MKTVKEMKILITGFEPIWGIKKTPSGDLAKLWASDQIHVDGVEVRSLVIPQLFRKSTEITCSEIMSFEPDAVLLYGATKKNNPVRFERFAINAELSAMGDNSRIPVRERPIVANGPPAYASDLPIDYLVDRVSDAGISAKTSQFAGTHVCNSILYGVRHFITKNNIPSMSGFIHMSFPNEYGVVEDGMWSTASFADLTKASIVTVESLRDWFYSNQNLRM